LDWPGIFAAAEAVGTQWYLVEQDTCPGDPFESLRTSRENLRRLLD
jgi:sugar phosphate isomerase/epimerase